MRKFFVLVLLLSFSIEGRSQLQVENVFSSTHGVRPVNFSYFGKKLMGFDMNAMIVSIYNLDYTLWKSIPVNISGYDKLTEVEQLSDKLFHTDTLLEANITVVNSNTNTPHSFIINENCTILYDHGMYVNTSVDWLDGQYKLLVYKSYGNLNFITEFIPLPGYLPCETCMEDTTGMGTNVNRLPNDEHSFLVADVVPNPSDKSATLSYVLPEGLTEGELVVYNSSGQEMQRLKLAANMGKVVLSIIDLPSGVYYYHIYSGGLKSVGNKMVVSH